MPDPIFFYHTPTTSPYSEVTYYDPTFCPWEEWYAWKPVKMVYWHTGNEDGFGKGIRVYKWIWGEKILRRKVIDRLSGPGRETAGISKYWEYTTLMGLLQSGH